MIPEQRDPEGLDRLDQLFPAGGITTRPVGEFMVTYNEVTRGAKIKFTVRDKAGAFQIVLKRAYSLDEGSAVVLQTWNASAVELDQTVNYDDVDPEMRTHASSFYWLEFSPILDGDKTLIGPQELVLNLDQTAPDAILDFDASHAAASGGMVIVGVVFDAPDSPNFGSCKIYISGYGGVADYVPIAQESHSPFTFSLEQTGEAVTLKAIAVSKNGIEATTGPTKALTLGTTATVPSKPMNCTADEISTGIQVNFPANPESNVTGYKIRRAALNAGEAAASTIATVVPTGERFYSYLDTDGLKEVYEYYVIATNAIGDSVPSDQIIEDFIDSSGRLPLNTAQMSNTATLDSLDAGADATVRVYGPGGVGTAWKVKFGFGNTIVERSYNAQTFTGKSYATQYYCYYSSGSFLLSTSAFDTLPDQTFLVGAVLTCAAGGAGGVGGGGGSTGGGGACFSGKCEVKTPDGDIRLDSAPPELTVLNRRKEPRAATLVVTDYEGPMYDMGDGKLVTPGHLIRMDDIWCPASWIFTERVQFSGKVYNLHIIGEQDFDEQHYLLADGTEVHNFSLPELEQ